MFEELDVTVVPFEKVFPKIQVQFLKHLSAIYNINTLYTGKFNQDVKKILLHFTIHETCKYFLELKSNYKHTILLVDSSFANSNFGIFEMYNKDSVTHFILNKFKRIKNQLPFPVVVLDKPLNSYKKDSGEVKELKCTIVKLVEEYITKPPHLRDIKAFTIMNGLKQLSLHYFDSVDFKKIFY